MGAVASGALESKRFYILLALAYGPLHGYAIHQQVQKDSQMSVYLSFTSLYRLLGEMARRGLVEARDEQIYALTEQGRRRLRAEANIIKSVGELALKRIG